MHEELLANLRRASRVVVLNVSGVSAESGVPTFRDAQTGLWAKFDPMELATPDAFQRDPALVWGWYEWRRATVQQAQPNAAHRAIAAMASRVPTFTLITQNVDDLHERAGNRDVVHLHGQIARPYCQRCAAPWTPPALSPFELEGRRMEPPECASCGGRVRPGVVWFGESLPEREWHTATEAANRCEVFFCIGTSSVVQPAASLTGVAINAGAVTVQINPNPTKIDGVVVDQRCGGGGLTTDSGGGVGRGLALLSPVSKFDRAEECGAGTVRLRPQGGHRCLLIVDAQKGKTGHSKLPHMRRPR